MKISKIKKLSLISGVAFLMVISGPVFAQSQSLEKYPIFTKPSAPTTPNLFDTPVPKRQFSVQPTENTRGSAAQINAANERLRQTAREQQVGQAFETFSERTETQRRLAAQRDRQRRESLYQRDSVIEDIVNRDAEQNLREIEQLVDRAGVPINNSLESSIDNIPASRSEIAAQPFDTINRRDENRVRTRARPADSSNARPQGFGNAIPGGLEASQNRLGFGGNLRATQPGSSARISGARTSRATSSAARNVTPKATKSAARSTRNNKPVTSRSLNPTLRQIPRDELNNVYTEMVRSGTISAKRLDELPRSDVEKIYAEWRKRDRYQRPSLGR